MENKESCRTASASHASAQITKRTAEVITMSSEGETRSESRSQIAKPVEGVGGKSVKRLCTDDAISAGCSGNKKAAGENVPKDNLIQKGTNVSFQKNEKQGSDRPSSMVVEGTNAKIFFHFRTYKHESQYLKNCHFESLDLTFDSECNLHYSWWQKVGTRIHELKLKDCRVTDALESHITDSLPNLKFFQMYLTSGKFAFLANYAVLRRIIRICQKKFSKIDLIVFSEYTTFTNEDLQGWRLICQDYNFHTFLSKNGKLVCEIPMTTRFDESKFSIRSKKFFRSLKKLAECYSVSLNGRK